MQIYFLFNVDSVSMQVSPLGDCVFSLPTVFYTDVVGAIMETAPTKD
jgi:hypothetical protein